MLRLRDDFDAEVNLRVVLPIAIRSQVALFDPSNMKPAITGSDHQEEVERNQQALDAAGHWGVPTMVVKGEPFFGQDRMETLRWRLEQMRLGTG